MSVQTSADISAAGPAEAAPPDAAAPRAPLLVLAVWFGLATGLVEVVLIAVKKFQLHRIVRVSPDVVWMAPLADIGMFLIGAALLWLVARVWRAAGRLRPATAVFAALSAFTIFLHYRPIAMWARALLALGVGVQAAALLARRPERMEALLRISGAWGGRLLGPLRHRTRAETESAMAAGSATRETAGAPGSAPGAAPVTRLHRRDFLATAAVGIGGLAAGVHIRQWLGERTALAALGPPPTDAPNVLLIVLDTVRAQSLSLYGYGRRTAPNLERFAREGVVFDHALATAPWTLPTHASMFTGRWAHELSTDWDAPLDDTYPTLAEVLARHGYTTAGFVANTFYTSYEHGLNRGFAHYEDYRVSAGQILASSALGQTIGCGNRNEIGCRLRGTIGYYDLLGRKSAPQVNRELLHWLDGRPGDRPFFAFLNYFDAHAPYLPPAPYDTAFERHAERGNPMHLDIEGWRWTPDQVTAEHDAYDEAIAALDARIGELLDELERRGVLDRTLLIIAADHGEEFFEHDVMTHGNSLYYPSLHVPLILRFPGHVPAGTRIEPQLSVRDLPATVLDLIGLGGPESFPGASLARYWDGADATQAATPLFSDVSGRTFRPPTYPISKGDMHSIVCDHYHYVRRGDGREELYDLQADPREMRDLSGDPARADVMRWFRHTMEPVAVNGSEDRDGSE